MNKIKVPSSISQDLEDNKPPTKASLIVKGTGEVAELLKLVEAKKQRRSSDV